MKRILILCTGNSARSQMAEGFFKYFTGNEFEIFSAGVKPVPINPLAIEVMKEAGVDISKHRSKSVDEFSSQQFDYVITVCDNARQACPVFPGKYKKMHWSFEDPACAEGTKEEKLNIFRKTRDEIKNNVVNFLGHLPCT
ncbi:MAG: arsenate reductase ArsC [Candidatus Omnitrophica bacterium]|nr:arsenate reductase ArsC [Candidatus Omnitrophota bacterium]